MKEKKKGEEAKEKSQKRKRGDGETMCTREDKTQQRRNKKRTMEAEQSRRGQIAVKSREKITISVESPRSLHCLPRFWTA